MTINKVTTCRPLTLNDNSIQEHINEQNADGWYLISVDNLIGWYRLFWAKETT